jgi:hypothetical protein
MAPMSSSTATSARCAVSTPCTSTASDGFCSSRVSHSHGASPGDQR